MTPKAVITIHCTATSNGHDVSSQTIRKWHLARGFDDIGYHMVIQPSGVVELGRPLNVMGAHVLGANLVRTENGDKVNIGIALVGNDRFTGLQFTSLRYKLDGIFLTYDIEKWDIWCHHEWPSAIGKKTCPNMRSADLHHWYWFQNWTAIDKYCLNKSVV